MQSNAIGFQLFLIVIIYLFFLKYLQTNIRSNGGIPNVKLIYSLMLST